MTIRFITEAGDYLIADDGSYLNTDELVADLVAASAFTADLTEEIDFLCDMVASASTTSDLTATITLSSSLAASASATVDLATSITLASDLAASASTTSDLYVFQGNCYSDLFAAASCSADVTAQITFASDSAAVGSVVSDLATSVLLAADAQGVVSIAPDLTNGIVLGASSAAEASITSAPITTSIDVAADTFAQSSAASDLATTIQVASDCLNTFSSSADLRTSIDAFASYIAVANLAGADLSTQVLLEAQQAANAYSEGLLGSIIEVNSSLYCESALTTDLTTQIVLSSASSALSSLSSDLTTSINLALTVTAEATASGPITTTIQLAADTTQTVSLQSSVTTSIDLATALTNNAVFAAELKTSINALSSLIGVSNIADASLTVYRVAPNYAPLGDLIYLAELQAYDPTTSSVITWRFASGRGYDNGGLFYPPRIEQPANLKRSIGGSSVGGRTSMSYGELTLANLDGGINALADDYFDGRTLTLKRGNPDMPYNTFTTVLVATVESVAMERERASIRLRDKAITLDQPFSTVKYAGTNSNGAGIEGTADDIMGQSKPRIFGRIALMPPILVNTSKLIYQINAGAVDNVINVFDAGAYLTRSTDYTSQADMEGNDPASGTWRAWPGGGCIRLGSVPYGQVSVCVAEKWDYTQCTAAGLIQRILTEVGYTSANWLASDFVTLNQKNAGSLGIVVADGETTAALLDRICQSVGAWWGFDSLGRFRVARLDAPSGTASATLTDNQILEIERQAADQLPVWQTVLKSDINYAKQDKKSLAGVVPSNRSNWFEQESRDQKVENASVKTQRLLAEDQTYDSLLNGISVASAESARRLALFSSRRDTVNLTVANPTEYYSSIDLGSVISVQTSKLGYDAGRLMTVTGVSLDYQANTMDITLWG